MKFTYSNEILENEIEEARQEWLKAGYIICDIERDIREINNNITNKNKLSILNKTLIEQKKLHAILEKNFYGKLEYMKNHMKKCFQKYVLDLNYNRCYIDQLSTRTHLISLLDDFSTSQKDFLVLKNQFRMPFTNNYISLIITYYYPGLDVIKIQPTMTELKKEQGKYVNQLTVDRLEPLKNTLLSLNQNNLKDGVVYTFDTPFMLGGQTSRNRQGYGNRWFGPNDYIEGTYYGEVTDFMISGFIMNSLFFNIQNKKEQDRIKEKSTKQINKTTKKHINTLKVFPKLLMENILSLCIEQYLNPIEVINKAIKRTEEENLNDFNFDKTILKTFNKYLNPYKEEYDYLVYLIYEVSKQLNCSIIKIISLSKESKSTIIKKILNDNRYNTLDKGYETVYHILPEVKDAEDYLLNFGEYKWYDVHNQLPLYVETEEDIRYSENDILISEDYRFYIYFNTFAEKITQSKKFNMKFSFPIYYQREYIAQNNTGYHCIKCNCDYSYDYEVKKQPGKWICPNCSTKNSCYKDYQFIQKTFPSEEDMK